MVSQGPKERHVRFDIDRMNGAVDGEIDHGGLSSECFRTRRGV
jgi:hypothetical protein